MVSNLCLAPSCNHPVKARNFCSKHYDALIHDNIVVRKNARPMALCVICAASMKKRGGKVTCSDACSDEHRNKKYPPRATKPRTPTNTKEYVLERVKTTNNGCWEWQRSINPQTGYGQIGSAPYTAHKLAFTLWNEREPAGVVRHQCHNKRCCNPRHLLDGTHRENWQDSENIHRRAALTSRGRTPANAIPVIIDGSFFPSQSDAMKALGVNFYALKRMISG